MTEKEIIEEEKEENKRNEKKLKDVISYFIQRDYGICFKFANITTQDIYRHVKYYAKEKIKEEKKQWNINIKKKRK